MHLPRAVAYLLFASLLGACSPTGTREPGDVCAPETKRQQRGRITSIGFEDFFMKHQGRDLVLIDARDPWFYRQGHIPGAINIAPGDGLEARLKALEPQFDKARQSGRIIAVYCNGFGCHDARTVSRAIADMGFDVAKFSAGWRAWKKSEMPVESASQTAGDL